MKKNKKKRLNLYLSEEAIAFAKQWSYVIGKPISKILEDQLNRQKNMVASITPFQWLNDPVINPELTDEDAHYRDMEEYLANANEKAFCDANPDHPRAKMRRAMQREYERYKKNIIDKKKENDKELIKRWMEIFTLKNN